MLAPREWVELLVADGYISREDADSGEPLYMHLIKDAPGTVTGPRSFYMALDDHLKDYHVDVSELGGGAGSGQGTYQVGRTSRPALWAVHERDKDGTFADKSRKVW